MQTSKLFITGGTGFVGSHILTELIQDGYSCKALYRNYPSVQSKAQWVKGDLLDPGSFELYLDEVDTIVHAAGFISYQKKDKQKLMYSNCIATKELVNSALNKKVKNFVYISSASTLIRSVDPLYISLKGSGTPVFNSYYAKTKFLAELEIWRAAAEGMNVCVLYPSLVIGGWKWNKSSMQIFGKVNSGISYYPLGNLGIVSAVDLAKIVSKICMNDMNGQRFLINAEVWSYNDFLNEIAKSLGKKKIIKEASNWQAYLLSLLNISFSFWNQNQAIITRETIKSSFSRFRYEPNLHSSLPNFNYQDIKDQIHEIVKQQKSIT